MASNALSSPGAAPRWRMLSPLDLEQLKKRTRELLRAWRAGDAEARALFAAYHPAPPPAPTAKLADAQLALARAHDFPSWPRFKHAVELYRAIVADDAEAVLALVGAHPALLLERVNGVTSNWGPPLACAAQVGSPRVFDALLPLPGQDRAWALSRAVLRGRIAMAEALVAAGTRPASGEAMGPCESLDVAGLRFLARIGAPLTDAGGDRLAPVAMILEGYHRDPEAKHACLAFFEERGIVYPDTPPVALHRGRIDLLETHRVRDPGVVTRRFAHGEIWPPALGCHEDAGLALHGTPLDGTTLLHMAVDFDELAIARWLLDHGADVNASATVDSEGFGGQTPLFHAVVSQAWRSGRQRDGAIVRLLLDHGADPKARASIRKRIRFHDDASVHIYRDVTPLEYGRAFHARAWVSEVALALIAQRSGRAAPPPA